jgi:stage V sporulation protein S
MHSDKEASHMAILKVSAHSRPTAVAGAIAGSVRETRRAEVQAIGADAVNQAVKAVAVARGYLEQDSIDVVCIPTFVDVEIEGEERTAIKLTVEPRDPNAPFPTVFRSRVPREG